MDVNMFIDENSKPKEKLKAWYLFTEDFIAGTQHLTNQERYEITNIRIPSEKIYLLNFASILRITFYRNLFALIVLKYLTILKHTIFV